MKKYRDFREFYNKSLELTKLALSKTLNTKDAILYARKNFNKSDLKSYYKIGTLTKEQIKILSTKENLIKLSIDSMIKNILEHPDLNIEDYMKLNKILHNPDKYIQDRKNNLRIFKNIDNKYYELIIKSTQNKDENFLTTFHRCDVSKLKQNKR
jgi:hypothetical protein